jgi:tetratricopeptide (TPR) repeat protein
LKANARFMKNFLASTLLILLLFLSTNYAFSQRADSLQRELNTHQKKDTLRAKLLLELFKETFIIKDPDTCLQMVEEALEISQKEKWGKGIVISYSRIGIVYGFLKGQYAEGLNYYLKALKANEAVKDMSLQKDILGNIGLIYHETRQYGKSEDFIQQALKIAREMKIPEHSSINIFICHANNYSELKLYDSAIIVYNKVISLAEMGNLQREKSIAASSLGTLYMRTNKLDSAMIYLQSAYRIAKQMENPLLEANVLQSLSLVFLKQGKVLKAQSVADTALHLSELIQNIRFQSYIWDIKCDIFIAQGKYKEALDAYAASVKLKDSIASVAKQQELGSLQTQYELEKKEAVKEAIHQSELKQQRTVKNSIAAGSGILLLGGLFSFLFYRRKRNAVEKQKEAEFKTEVAETEMKALRAQMNPHFMFNSLNSIGDYISQNKTDIANEYLAKFARLMRMVLENSEKKQVTLADDLKALELYMQLEALRMNHKFSYVLEIDTTIDPETTLVPPLLLQPFVENSIWHGIAKKNGTGKIKVTVTKDGEMVKCTIEDDGIGRQQAKEEQGPNTNSKKSLGMKITNARIQILNKVKSAAASIQLFDLSQGTKVELKLPLETY